MCEYLVILGQVSQKLEILKSNNIKFLVIRDLTSTRIELSDNVKMDIEFEKVDAKYINLNRCTDSSLETTYVTADHLGISGGSFNKVEFYHECIFNFTASAAVGDNSLPMKSFQLSSSHIAKDRTFLIEQASIEELQFNMVQNDGLIKIFNCDVTRWFIVHKSNLGRTHFTGININNCRVDVLDSNVHEVLFNSFRWNRDHKLSPLYDAWVLVRYKNQIHFLESLRESYRQLKANYAKNGNKIESLEFQKGEMNTHFLILSQLQFKSWKNFGNYLIVATNKLFSDFGQNIWKPFCFLMISHLLFLNLNHMAFDLGLNYPRSPSGVDWEQTWKAANLYFHTLIPTHTASIRTLDDREVSITGLWDFLDRIMAGYFIFYFITASRKYHYQ